METGLAVDYFLLQVYFLNFTQCMQFFCNHGNEKNKKKKQKNLLKKFRNDQSGKITKIGSNGRLSTKH